MWPWIIHQKKWQINELNDKENSLSILFDEFNFNIGAGKIKKIKQSRRSLSKLKLTNTNQASKGSSLNWILDRSVYSYYFFFSKDCNSTLNWRWIIGISIHFDRWIEGLRFTCCFWVWICPLFAHEMIKRDYLARAHGSQDDGTAFRTSSQRTSGYRSIRKLNRDMK